MAIKREKHRAVKPRPVRPLDKPKPDNHAARRLDKAHDEALLEAATKAATK